MLNRLLYRIHRWTGRKLSARDGGHFEYLHRSTASGGEMIDGILPSGDYKLMIAEPGYKLRISTGRDDVEVIND